MVLVFLGAPRGGEIGQELECLTLFPDFRFKRHLVIRASIPTSKFGAQKYWHKALEIEVEALLTTISNLANAYLLLALAARLRWLPPHQYL